jgi:hypothetical protein
MLAPVVCAAQQAERPKWGTSSDSVVSVTSAAFAPSLSPSSHAINLMGGSFCLVSGSVPQFVAEFVAPVDLPTGALIKAVEFRICDSMDTGWVYTALYLNRKNAPSTFINLVDSGTGLFETPGCVNRKTTLATPITVDNDSTSYAVSGVLDVQSGGVLSVGICSAHIYYQRQVSPAPATATFADVPVGHPLHRFVEALVASGITGGCGGGNYCPDAPLTRGQMAVFLAAALGLHWPN